MRRRTFLTATAATAALAGLELPAASADAHSRLQTGFEVLAGSGYHGLAGRKVGFISNPTGVRRDLQHEVDVMHSHSPVNVVAVFGPEHGFRGTAQAGGSQGFYTDAKTGLPVYDLYGATIASTVDIYTKAGVDLMLFDIQEIDARFYTYIWTMYRSMAAAAIRGIPFVVLDRPAPLGGTRVAGPVLRPALSTGVGVKPICQQYGMTMGELARLFNSEFVPADAGGKKADLVVVPLRGWSRDMDYYATGLPWVLPSPNIPTVDSAFVYPGNGMFEGTNLSEGRGTTKPFQMIGAPYVDYHWVDALNAQHLPGVTFRENYFAPTFNKYLNETCGGVELYVTDRRAYDPIRTAVAMIITAKKLYPAGFQWRYDTGDPIDPYWIDKLSGSDYLRTAVDAGRTTDEVVAGWQPELAAFKAVRAKYLIYRGGS